MGKVLKVVAIIAVAAAIAYFAPQLTPQFLSAAIGSTAATAAVSAALTIAASAAMAALTPKPSSSASPSVFRQSIANSFIIYGKRRVGGLLIFFHPLGKNYRYFVIAAAGHRCKGVTRWFLGDEQVSVNAAGMVTSGKYANNAWLWFYRGTDDQVAHPTFVAETQGKWTANHRGRGLALIYAKFKMTNDIVQAGMPNITAEVEGKDDILDPRTDVRGYTRNAALVFYDWMAMAREEGGFGAYDDEIDWDWVAAQANVCDEEVSTPAGMEKRYEFDSYIQTGAAPSEVRDTFVTCCAGKFSYTNGKMLMRPGYYVPPSNTLLEEDLASPFTVPALLTGDEVATEVTGTYVEPSMYQPMDVPTRSIDSSDIRQATYDLAHITSHYRGQRILEYFLRKAQAERRVSWPMNIMGIAISTLDTVQLATSKYGLSNYAFQVTGWGLNQDFSVGLQLEEHNADLFEFDAGSYHTVGTQGTLTPADPIGDGVASPTDVNVTAGTTSAAISWRNPTEASFAYCRVYRGTTDAFIAASPVSGSIIGGLGQILQVTDTVPGGIYYWWVVAFDSAGNQSDPAGPVTASVGVFDFAAGSLPSGATLTRASTKIRTNSSGSIESVAIDAPAIEYHPTSHAVLGVSIEPSATNEATNNSNSGAVAGVIGSGGALPTGWTMPEGNGGAAVEVKSITTVAGFDIIEIQMSGTATSAAALTLRPDTAGAAASAGQAWTNSLYLALSAGSLTNVAGFQLRAGSETGGTSLGGITSALARYTNTRTLTSTSARQVLRFNWSAVGAAINLTLKIASPQRELGGKATSPIKTSGAVATRAADALVLSWASRNVPDGAITVRYTFDDGSTQDVATTVSGGNSTVPTNLNRPIIRKVERV
ncbi:hypothetical protein [Sphingobium sp. WCS2017Hpa-17]|uniref:phage head spike fiber domain-containing protein n=1 Tax=Sphingobium sp. WCS2017Hpa-17 TaxID=3073638 RepID=UPI0028892E15|nr:hypothetical protein [Sphingobium sp. WCS2017Hpa-17]